LRFVYNEIDIQTAAQRVGSRSEHLCPTTLVNSQFAALESPVGEADVLRVSGLQSTQEQVDAIAAWLGITRHMAAQPAP
jgi:gluconokinase